MNDKNTKFDDDQYALWVALFIWILLAVSIIIRGQ
jgi:hypothetical protein